MDDPTTRTAAEAEDQVRPESDPNLGTSDDQDVHKPTPSLAPPL